MPGLDTTRPFTRAQARAAGITAKVLRGPRFRRIFREVYVDASVVDTPRLRVEAALLLHCRAAASHASAARVYELPIPTLPEEHVTVRDPKQRRRREGIRCHCVAGHRSRVVHGIRLSTPEQLFVEMGTLIILVDHVVLGDSMVRRKLTTPERLRKAAASATGHGAVAAREAAAYVRRGVDSPMETRLRMLLVVAGIPEPEINLTIRDVDGEPIRRYDLSWPAARTPSSTTAATTSSARRPGSPTSRDARRATTRAGRCWCSSPTTSTAPPA